jgi:hypothetical protein
VSEFAVSSPIISGTPSGVVQRRHLERTQAAHVTEVASLATCNAGSMAAMLPGRSSCCTLNVIYLWLYVAATQPW